jgi:hypothetical protein
MSTKNPLTYGFGAIRRDPALLLVEILWRWCFGALSLLLFLGFLVMRPEVVAAGDGSAWSSQDPLLIAQALLRLLTGLGGTLLGAAGRTFTLNRLERSGIRFRSILALQGLRAVFLWLAGIALTKTIALDARLAGHGVKPDIFLYSALAVWSVILIGALWAAVNWNLSLAAVCCAKNAGGFGRSIRQALALDRSHSGDLLGVSLVFALWRLIVLAVAFVLWFLPSAKMATAPRAYFAWFLTTMLAYFAASDFLHIARMAGYLAIDPLDSNGNEVGTSRPGLPGNEPIAH